MQRMNTSILPLVDNDPGNRAGKRAANDAGIGFGRKRTTSKRDVGKLFLPTLQRSLAIPIVWSAEPQQTESITN
jgi:hypothetical protein